MIQQIERKVLFRTTKVFAWAVIISALVAFVFYGSKIIQTTLDSKKREPVTYEEVKNRLQESSAKSQRGQQPYDSMADAATRQLGKYHNSIEELLNAFGESINREAARSYFMNLLQQIDDNDRNDFLVGLIAVVKQAPMQDKPKSAEAYIGLWQEKKTKNTAQALNNERIRSESFILAASSFATVAIFTLLLVLLAIEKNTRTEDTKLS